jgi:hypothetical protein
LREEVMGMLEELLVDAHRSGDVIHARGADAAFIEELDDRGVRAAAIYLREAESQVFTFLTHSGAGRLLFGDPGRPELATSVLERVMRELNRRTDNGNRWSIEGMRALLRVKLGRKCLDRQRRGWCRRVSTTPGWPAGDPTPRRREAELAEPGAGSPALFGCRGDPQGQPP